MKKVAHKNVFFSKKLYLNSFEAKKDKKQTKYNL